MTKKHGWIFPLLRTCCLLLSSVPFLIFGLDFLQSENWGRQSYNSLLANYFLIILDMFSLSSVILLGTIATAWARAPLLSRESDNSLLVRGLGEYLGNNGSPQWGGNKPWGSRTCSDDPKDVPYTGKLLSASNA